MHRLESRLECCLLKEGNIDLFLRFWVIYFTGTLSVERGNCLKGIAENLNKLTDPMFKVDDRSVRDRFRNLEKKYKNKNKENQASRIEVAEEGELEKGLTEIIQLFEDSKKHQEERNNKKSKEEIEKKIRLRSFEESFWKQ